MLSAEDAERKSRRDDRFEGRSTLRAVPTHQPHQLIEQTGAEAVLRSSYSVRLQLDKGPPLRLPAWREELASLEGES